MSKLPRHQLAAVLAERSLAQLDVKTFSDELAAYLLSEHRTGELDSLMRDIMQYRADHGVVEVVAVSAHTLTDSVRKDIESQVRELYPAAKKVIISEEIDPVIIGGVRIELANQQLDLSIRAKLNRFKQLTAVGE
jgi:F-type H+-transporting ATPase subunit delta